MAVNTDPIYSKAGVIGPSVNLTTQANDYTGVSQYNRVVFTADATNGGYVQRLRFKARGTNIATVARIYIGNGSVNTNFATAPAAPTGTGSSTGGSMIAGSNYFGVIVAIGPDGAQSVVGTYSAAATVTGGAGNAGSISWAYTPVLGATSHRLYVTDKGGPTGTAAFYFDAGTTSPYVQTTMPETGTAGDPTTGNQFLFAEVSLPATTATATAATADIDVPLNIALPPGYEILVGLGTTVAAGWQVSSIGGAY
jgi:hypothetical protein